MGIYIAIAVVVLIIIFAIYTYNRLVSLRNRVQNGWSQIDERSWKRRPGPWGFGSPLRMRTSLARQSPPSRALTWAENVSPGR